MKAALLITAALASPALAGAPCKPATGDVRVTLGKNTTLHEVVTWRMSFTCDLIVIDPLASTFGKYIDIVAPDHISVADAYKLFDATLATMRLRSIRRARFIRIVDMPSALYVIDTALLRNGRRTLEFPTRGTP